MKNSNANNVALKNKITKAEYDSLSEKEKDEMDEVDQQNQEMMEKDYEASFPGFENN